MGDGAALISYCEIDCTGLTLATDGDWRLTSEGSSRPAGALDWSKT